MAADASYYIYVATISCTGSILFGLDIGYLSALWVDGHFKDYFGVPNAFDKDAKFNSITVGIVSGAFSIGAICGSFPPVSATFLDNQGRKGTMFAGGIIFIIGCVIQVVAQWIHMITVGRFVAGISIGLLSASIPLYQSEIAPASWRGKLTSVYQLNITIGILIAQVLNVTVLNLGANGWRYSIACQLIPAIGFVVLLPTLPYSPTWLIKQGRLDEAKQTLIKMRGEEIAIPEFEQLRKIDERDKAIGLPSWSDALGNPRIRGLAMVGVAIQLFQQLCGMNVFMYYGPIIYEEAGLNGAITGTLVALNNTLSTFLGMFTIDLAGRTVLLSAGAVVMIGCSLVMAIFASMPFVKVGAVFVFVTAFASTWGPTAWVYCAEIYPSKYRSRLVGISTSANWIGNWTVATGVPYLLEIMGYYFYYVLVVTNSFNLMFGLWAPETKGVELHNIPAIWDGKLPADPDQISDARKTN